MNKVDSSRHQCRVCDRQFIKCKAMVGKVHCKIAPKRCGYCWLHCRKREK